MDLRNLAGLVFALLIGLAAGSLFLGGTETREPVLAHRTDANGTQRELLERIARALEALDTRLANQEPLARPAPAPAEPVRRGATEPTPRTDAGLSQQVLAVLRQIESHLRNNASAAANPSAGPSFESISAQRAQWLELTNRRLPPQPDAIQDMVRRYIAADWTLPIEDFFLRPADIMQRCGWPTRIERGNDEGNWELVYSGLSIFVPEEEERLIEVVFEFRRNELVHLAYEVDE